MVAEKLDFTNPEIRFSSFESYVQQHGHGITIEEAREKVEKGAALLKAIQNDAPVKGTKEENISNLVWFMTARSYGDPYMLPMDNGMYTISLEGDNATQRLNDYFAGSQATSHPILRALTGIIPALLSIPINFLVSIKRIFIPAPNTEFPGFAGMIDGIAKLFGKRGPGFNPERTAYGRESSHFKKEVKNHFGYDIRDDKNMLPGKFNTVAFGLVEVKGEPTRLYFKPEEAGIDVLHHPTDSLAHSAHFLGIHKSDENEVSAKEKFVHNQEILTKYSDLMEIETIHRKESNAGKLNLNKMRNNISKHYAGKPELQEKLNEFEGLVASTHSKDTLQSGGENACYLSNEMLEKFTSRPESIERKVSSPTLTDTPLFKHPTTRVENTITKIESTVSNTNENESKPYKKNGGP